MTVHDLMKMAAAGREPIDVLSAAADIVLVLDDFVDDESKPGSARAWIDWLLLLLEDGKLPLKVHMTSTAGNVLRRRGKELE